MKVREKIHVITDLFLGALYADRRFGAAERSAIRQLRCELIVRDELPSAVERRIAEFSPEHFDLAAVAREFRSDPPMKPRRLLELVSQLCMANGELDLDEDEYLHRLGRALELDPVEYDDIVLDYEVSVLASSQSVAQVGTRTRRGLQAAEIFRGHTEQLRLSSRADSEAGARGEHELVGA